MIARLLRLALEQRFLALPNALRLSGRREWTRISLRSEEHTSELQSPKVISYAVFCLKKRFF